MGWGIFLLVALNGCGDDGARAVDESPRGPGVEAPANAAGGGAGRSCRPATVEHRFGVTEVRVNPSRVVPLSVRDQEVLIALGIQPVAVVDGPYLLPYVEWPWVPPELAASNPARLEATSPNFEQVAGLEPDLLLGFASGLTDEEYRILSRLAPTVAQSDEYVDHGVPWQVLTRTLGRVTCRMERAETLIRDVEERLVATRRQLPEFEGRTSVVAMAGGPEGAHWAYGPEDSRVRFLRSLGFELPDDVGQLARGRFVATVSPERVDLFDVDLLIWLASADQREALEADPLYQALDVVREGRVVYLEPDGPEVAALTNTSPLNIPYLLDGFVPRLAGVLDGAGESQ